MRNPAERMKVFTIYSEYAKNALYIIAFITAISGFLTYILNAITAPPVDYIYTVVKTPNPVRKDLGQFEPVINFLSDKIKEGKLPEKDSKGAKEFMAEWTKLMEIMVAGNEINADQVRVWVLNLSRHPLEKINIGFQRCTGYVRHETDPISHVTNESTTQNSTSSSNGVMYRYGAIEQEKSVYLKFGFKDIQDCYVTVEANSGGSMAKGKEVASDEYTEYQNQLLYRRSIYFQYVIPILCFTVVLLLIVIGIAYKNLSARIKTIESK